MNSVVFLLNTKSFCQSPKSEKACFVNVKPLHFSNKMRQSVLVLCLASLTVSAFGLEEVCSYAFESKLLVWFAG